MKPEYRVTHIFVQHKDRLLLTNIYSKYGYTLLKCDIISDSVFEIKNILQFTYQTDDKSSDYFSNMKLRKLNIEPLRIEFDNCTDVNYFYKGNIGHRRADLTHEQLKYIDIKTYIDNLKETKMNEKEKSSKRIFSEYILNHLKDIFPGSNLFQKYGYKGEKTNEFS